MNNALCDFNQGLNVNYVLCSRLYHDESRVNLKKSEIKIRNLIKKQKLSNML